MMKLTVVKMIILSSSQGWDLATVAILKSSTCVIHVFNTIRLDIIDLTLKTLFPYIKRNF